MLRPFEARIESLDRSNVFAIYWIKVRKNNDSVGSSLGQFAVLYGAVCTIDRVECVINAPPQRRMTGGLILGQICRLTNRSGKNLQIDNLRSTNPVIAALVDQDPSIGIILSVGTFLEFSHLRVAQVTREKFSFRSV